MSMVLMTPSRLMRPGPAAADSVAMPEAIATGMSMNPASDDSNAVRMKYMAEVIASGLDMNPRAAMMPAVARTIPDNAGSPS